MYKPFSTLAVRAEMVAMVKETILEGKIGTKWGIKLHQISIGVLILADQVVLPPREAQS